MRELDPLVSRAPVESARPGAHRDPEELRAAAERARGTLVLGLGPPRQEPPLPHRRRRARPARPPHERGSAPLPRPRQEGPGEADVPDLVRRRRGARAHGGGEEEAGRCLAPHAGRAGGGARPPRPGCPRGGREPRSGSSCAESGVSCTRSSATSARLPGSVARMRTRFSGRRGYRRSGSRRSSRTTRSQTLARRSTTTCPGRSSSGSPGRATRACTASTATTATPARAAATTLRRVDFEEHTITYCAACQTDGRILKDRRLSRLLR